MIIQDKGVFRLNERLFPEAFDNPFQSAADADILSFDDKTRDLAADEPPVK